MTNTQDSEEGGAEESAPNPDNASRTNKAFATHDGTMGA